MKKQVKFLIGMAFVILPLLGAGCVYTLNVEPNPALDKLPVVDQAPVTVGIYYSPEFAGYEHIRHTGHFIIVVPVGESSVAMLDEIFPRIFAKVVKLEALPTSATPNSEVDWVIEPAVEAADWGSSSSDSDRYSLTYRVTIFSREGIPVSSWTVLGHGTDPGRWYYLSTWGYISAYISGGMQDAAGKIMRKFQAAYAEGKPPMFPPHSLAKRGNPGRAPRAGAVSVRAELNMEPKWLQDMLAPSEPLWENPDFAAEKDQAWEYTTEIIPIHISLRNIEEREIVVRESDFRLVLPNGRRIAPAGETAVGWRLAMPDSRERGVDALHRVLGLGRVSACSSCETKEEHFEKLDRLRELRFGEQTLAKGGTAQGFAYFIPAKGTPAFDEARLSLWLWDPESSNGVEHSLALKEIEYIGYQGPADEKRMDVLDGN